MRRITKAKPEKKLTVIRVKNGGRNSLGKVTARSRGGEMKRYLRIIDFKRDKKGIKGKVEAFEYDPNRNVEIALIYYPDGDKSYILAPVGLNVGDRIISDDKTDISPGNAALIGNLPVGTQIHNIELTPGRGGQIVRSAGSQATLIAKEDRFVHVKMPSGEVRKVFRNCMASIGQLANADWKFTPVGSAGKSRRLGRRPKVRGVAQHPGSHPHGGGEGRSGEGMHPKTPWGKLARGGRTRKKKKYSNKYIIKRRKI